MNSLNSAINRISVPSGSYTHDIEAVSCDEMLVDCTDLLADTGASPLEFAEHLREQIVKKTQCHASAGMGECHGESKKRHSILKSWHRLYYLIYLLTA